MACSSSCRLEHVSVLSSIFLQQLLSSLCRSCLRHSCCWDFMGATSCGVRRHCLRAGFLFQICRPQFLSLSLLEHPILWCLFFFLRNLYYLRNLESDKFKNGNLSISRLYELHWCLRIGASAKCSILKASSLHSVFVVTAYSLDTFINISVLASLINL